MLILIAFLMTTSAEKPATIRELSEQPIPKEDKHLKGQALVDYVNKHQNLWKAEYKPGAEDFAKVRVMDAKYLNDPYDGPLLKHTNLDGLPERFDAREVWKDCPIDFIRDQSNCGSCWAVASASVMGDRACAMTQGGYKMHASDSDILACCEYCGRGCDGGFTTQAWQYIMFEGVCSGGLYGEKGVCMPYTFYPCGQHANQPYYGECPKGGWKTPKCRRTCQLRYHKKYEDDRVYAGGFAVLANSEASIRSEIMTNGPVAATFMVFEDFVHYKGGIYKYSYGDVIGAHAVKVLGWGTENGTDYWLIANSWNKDWGENGYFRFLRGSNHLGIEERVSVPFMKSEQ